MRVFIGAVLGFVLVGGAVGAIAATALAPVTVTPDSLHWVAGTGTSKGSWAATLSGDPNTSGPAVQRVKLPDGYVNRPHYHSHVEYITVIQGTLLFGTGDEVAASKAKTLPTGSFIVVPAGVHHWSIVKGETIEQVSGEAPFKNIPVKR